MWIRELPKELLEELITESVCAYMASSMDGDIHWASEAFQEWSGYTGHELQKLGWKKISADDDNLAADIAAAAELRDGLRTSYQVDKRYIPKNGSPQWGTLHVRRIPAKGDFQFAWCHWSPLRAASVQPLELAIKHAKTAEQRLEEVISMLKIMTSQTAEQTWVLSTIHLAMKYPKIGLFIFTCIALGAASAGATNVLRFGAGILNGDLLKPEAKAETETKTAAAGPSAETKTYVAETKNEH